MTRTLRPLLLMLALLLAAGCATAAGERLPSNDATLVVSNQSTAQMRIYVVSGGQRIRLGSVQGISDARLRIPGSAVGLGRDLRFQALPMGSNTVANSWNLFVRPGQQVTLTIAAYVR